MTRINILLPCPGLPTGRYWGDYHFGHSLAKALERRGISVRIIYRPHRPFLARFSLRSGTDIVIRGPFAHLPRVWPWVKSHLWLISTGEITPNEVKADSHIFAASQQLADEQAALGRSATVLLQCTDAAIFSPHKARDDLATDVLFVGSWRVNFHRPVVAAATEAGFPPVVWGHRWRDKYPAHLFRGVLIPNDELGAHYASAKVVLNDHLPSMLSKGLVSNRVYDVLASGAALISDALADLGPDIPSAQVASTAEQLKVAIPKALEDHEAGRAARLELAEFIRTHHNFDQRAQEILRVLGIEHA